MTKCIYTLVLNDYAPAIRALTFPLLSGYANKIHADVVVINERKFPEWPLTYEKLQINERARIYGHDWNIFFDADALISPEFFDPTDHLPMNTVCHNGQDMAGIRWRYDEYFRRDGRNIGSCNWQTYGSKWCLDLWRPLDDITPEQAFGVADEHGIYRGGAINVTIGEHNSGHCKAEHLIDDYTLSRNIARFGLKFTTVNDICERIGFRLPTGRGFNPYCWHKYTIPESQKVREMLAILSTPNGAPAFAEPGELARGGDGGPVLKTPDGRFVQPCGSGWGLMTPEEASEFRQQWKLGA